MKKFCCLILIGIFITLSNVKAQEMDAIISISHSKIQGTSNDKIFQELRKALFEFINNTTWTNHVYSQDERIECRFVIDLTEQVSSDEFKGTLQIMYSRPIHGTSYMSPVIKHVDEDLHFRYVEFETLEFNQNSHSSNLTSIMAYWVYVILGFDYDTYGNAGGTEYFQKAEKIVQNAQSAQEKGWRAFENLKNRYWLVENILNDQFSPIRDFSYGYHRQGMDKLGTKAYEAKASIEEAIENLKAVHRRKPNSLLVKMITTAKKEEIINVFSESFPDEKARIINIMKEIDPANSSDYDDMMKNQ